MHRRESRREAHLEDAALANFFEIQHLHSSFRAGNDDGTLKPGVEADHGWRRGEGDRRHGAEVASVVQLEVGIGKRESLPAQTQLISIFRPLAITEEGTHRIVYPMVTM